jgi:hypothetical protein
MLSGKQKRAAMLARRQAKRDKAAIASLITATPSLRPPATVVVNKQALAPCNSYGEPEFAKRGYYQDLMFDCRDCGARQVWKAEQQQWWYEIAKGYVYSTAVRCLSCRLARRLAHGGTPRKIRKAA